MDILRSEGRMLMKKIVVGGILAALFLFAPGIQGPASAAGCYQCVYHFSWWHLRYIWACDGWNETGWWVCNTDSVQVCDVANSCNIWGGGGIGPEHPPSP